MFADPCQGNAYLCDTYAPVAVSENLSYGFAIMRNKTNCCKCYELQWRSGTPAAGKKMQVQIINIGVSCSPLLREKIPFHPPVFHPSDGITTQGDQTTDGANDLIIYTPGGGVGPVFDGCRLQYGKSW